MRRLLLLVVCLFLSALSLHADADDAQGRRRHDDPRVLKVFDANGELVGRLASYHGADGVYLAINGAIVFAAVTWLRIDPNDADSSRFQWSTFGPFSYPTADCSGSPIIPPGNGPRPSIAMRSGADVTLLIAGDTVSSGVRIVAVSDGTHCTPPPFIGHVPPSTAPVPAFTAETNYALTAHHPEPLTIGY
ncbi:hypothetical protein AWB75_05276 [Caballeronia catudaia]|uniref:Uncharacterized protein n=1 Tax=Caballeronia catudaia TaxID=1777136 RepID=A0A158CK13_9BURK|nr:hypothetical protein [Caballeronia catudaia]SAK82620.1 hypothetical protein AWB75_05276 [Caballeronia catudaia]